MAPALPAHGLLRYPQNFGADDLLCSQIYQCLIGVLQGIYLDFRFDPDFSGRVRNSHILLAEELTVIAAVNSKGGQVCYC